MRTWEKPEAMKRVEAEFEEPMEVLLPSLLNQHPMTRVAAMFKVSKSTVHYWCMRLNITLLNVWLKPGEEIIIKGAKNANHESDHRGDSLDRAGEGQRHITSGV